jgi:hypothetical protein
MICHVKIIFKYVVNILERLETFAVLHLNTNKNKGKPEFQAYQ